DAEPDGRLGKFEGFTQEMIIVCKSCNSRFRVDDEKVPAGSFTVACPKCQTTVNSSAMNPEASSAVSMGKSPSTSHPRFQRTKPAPLFRADAGANEKAADTRGDSPSVGANEL